MARIFKKKKKGVKGFEVKKRSIKTLDEEGRQKHFESKHTVDSDGKKLVVRRDSDKPYIPPVNLETPTINRMSEADKFKAKQKHKETRARIQDRKFNEKFTIDKSKEGANKIKKKVKPKATATPPNRIEPIKPIVRGNKRANQAEIEISKRKELMKSNARKRMAESKRRAKY